MIEASQLSIKTTMLYVQQTLSDVGCNSYSLKNKSERMKGCYSSSGMITEEDETMFKRKELANCGTFS